MKAVFYQGNKRLSVEEIEIVPPGPGEIQLKVEYAGICGSDYHIYLGDWDRRVKAPKVIGHEMSGEVASIGKGVCGYEVGNKVVVCPIIPCHNCKPCRLGHYNLCHNIGIIGMDTPGAFQQYWTVPAYTVRHLPDSINMRQAAMIEPLAVALHAVRRGKVTDNDFVVVQGAGPIGTLIALLSRMNGARVLVSEINKFRVNLVHELGVEVINPLENDLAGYVHERTNGENADVVFDASGSTEAAEIMTELVGTYGRIVIVGQFPEPVKVNLRRILWWECSVTGSRNYGVDDFSSAISLVASKKLPLSKMITDIRPLDRLPATFEEIDANVNFMKILLKL